MDYTALVPYFLALAALTAAPGPMMAVLVARSMGRDTAGATAFAAGLCAGDVLAVSAVALGIGVWFQGQPELMSVVKFLGIAYLLWLAVGMWNERSAIAAASGHKTGWLASAGAGVAVCLGNPSTLLVYMLLLPGLAPSGIVGVGQMVPVVLVTFAAVAMVFFGTILLARQLNWVVASPDSATMLSRLSAGAVAGSSLFLLAV